MSTAEPTARPRRVVAGFRVDRTGDSYTPVIVYADGGEFRHCPCACLDQAASLVTHGETRPLLFLGMREYRAGVLADVDPDFTCTVPRGMWTWAQHGFTHGTVARLAQRTGS